MLNDFFFFAFYFYDDLKTNLMTDIMKDLMIDLTWKTDRFQSFECIIEELHS